MVLLPFPLPGLCFGRPVPLGEVIVAHGEQPDPAAGEDRRSDDSLMRVPVRGELWPAPFM